MAIFWGRLAGSGEDPGTREKRGKGRRFSLDDEEAIAALAEDIRNASNAHLPRFSQIYRVELVDVPFERTAKGSVKRHLYQ